MYSEVAKPTQHLARFLVRLRSREAAKFFSNLAGTPGDLDLVLTATVCSAQETLAARQVVVVAMALNSFAHLYLHRNTRKVIILRCTVI